MPPMFSIDHPVWEVADLARLGGHHSHCVPSRAYQQSVLRSEERSCHHVENGEQQLRPTGGETDPKWRGGGETNPKW